MSSEAASPDDAVVFVGVSLVLGIASRHFLRGTRVPYTVALLILGIAMGSLGTCVRYESSVIPLNQPQPTVIGTEMRSLGSIAGKLN